MLRRPATKIKSPQLYRLSYRPRLGFLAIVVSRCVPGVPRLQGSPVSTTVAHAREPYFAESVDVLEPLRRVTSGGFS